MSVSVLLFIYVFLRSSLPRSVWSHPRATELRLTMSPLLMDTFFVYTGFPARRTSLVRFSHNHMTPSILLPSPPFLTPPPSPLFPSSSPPFLTHPPLIHFLFSSPSLLFLTPPLPHSSSLPSPSLPLFFPPPPPPSLLPLLCKWHLEVCYAHLIFRSV